MRWRGRWEGGGEKEKTGGRRDRLDVPCVLTLTKSIHLYLYFWTSLWLREKAGQFQCVCNDSICKCGLVCVNVGLLASISFE